MNFFYIQASGYVEQALKQFSGNYVKTYACVYDSSDEDLLKDVRRLDTATHSFCATLVWKGEKYQPPLDKTSDWMNDMIFCDVISNLTYGKRERLKELKSAGF